MLDSEGLIDHEAKAVRHGASGILVNEQQETDEPGLFAIGDVATQQRRDLLFP